MTQLRRTVTATRLFRLSATTVARLVAGIYRALLETRDRFDKNVSARLPLQVLNPEATKLNVKIPGSYVGLPTSRAGASHNAIEDIAIFRTLPNMRVADPGDNADLRAVIRTAVETCRQHRRYAALVEMGTRDTEQKAALKLAARHPSLSSIVTMANDTGQRYFTTALCGEDKKVDVPVREHPMDPKTQRDLDRYQSAWEILT